MGTTYRANISNYTQAIIEDYKGGLNIKQMSSKYKLPEQVVYSVLSKYVGFIERARLLGKPLRENVRELYEKHFLDIAKASADGIGYLGLSEQLGLEYYVIRSMMLDLASEDVLNRFTRRRYRREYTDEFKGEIKNAYRCGMSFTQIRDKYRICYDTIEKILDGKM